MTNKPATAGYADGPASGESGNRLPRLAAAFCVMVQIGILFVWTRDYLTCIALAVLAWSAGLGLRVPGRSWLRTRRTYIALGVAVAVKHTVAPMEVSPVRDYGGTSQTAFEIAVLFLLCQIGVLFGYVERRIPYWYPVFAVTSMLLISDVTIQRQQERYLLLAAVVATVLMAALVFRRSRRTTPGWEWSGWMPHLTAVLLSIGFGCGAAALLDHYERAIDRFLATSLGITTGPRDSVGFSGNGELGEFRSFKEGPGDDKLALRVFADGAPGYLAGKVFYRYFGKGWQDPMREGQQPPDRDLGRRPVPPATQVVFADMAETRDSLIGVDPTVLAFEALGRELFEFEAVRAGASEDVDEPEIEVIEIWPERSLPGVVFRASEANYLAIADPSLTVDHFGNVLLDKEQQGKPYSVIRVTGHDRAPPSRAMRAACLSLDGVRYPEMLEAQLRDRSHAIFRDRDLSEMPANTKCRLIAEYFRRNYRYTLRGPSFRSGNGGDVVSQFLAKAEAGHCEYFASATVLLLRYVGVPSRYVTGFVAEERNEIGGFWVARNRDAHAWVEAWDDELQHWIVVESTPSVGVPQASEEGTGVQLRDALTTMFQRWQASLRSESFRKELNNRAAQLFSPRALLTIGIIAAVMAAILAYLQSQRRRFAELAEFHATLDSVESSLRRRGLVRRPNETLRAFAARVADDGDGEWAMEATHWFNDYAAARYRRSQTSDEVLNRQLDHLHFRAEELKELIKAAPRVSVHAPTDSE